jgi:hypothetical protein
MASLLATGTSGGSSSGDAELEIAAAARSDGAFGELVIKN